MTEPTPFRDGAGLTAATLRGCFASYPSGVTAVCALLDGTPAGMIASSFTSVSLDPPLVSVCVALTSTTWPRLRVASRLGLSVLGDRHGATARALAARTGDRFARVEWTAEPGGAVFIPGAPLWLECALDREVGAGDHDIALLRVCRAAPHPGIAPLVFHGSRFRTLAVE